MGMLPWDDWIYHLDFMRDEVNTKHAQIVNTQDTVQSEVLSFNKQLDKYKLLLANNALLVYISSTTQMTDLKLADFTVAVDALPPPVKGDVVLNALSEITELVGSVLALKFIFNLGKLLKNAEWGPLLRNLGQDQGVAEVEMQELIGNIADDAADAGLEDVVVDGIENVGEDVAEDAVEGVVEGATSATLAATGIGILVAVGLDVIFSAINGAKEKSELQGILDKLDIALGKVNIYLKTVDERVAEVNKKTVEGITTFKKIATDMTALLPEGHKPTFKIDFPEELASLDTCLADQQLALTQFLLLLQLRETYVKALQRNPNVTKETVVNAVLISAPDWCTGTMLDDIWTKVLAKYSTLMKSAK